MLPIMTVMKMNPLLFTSSPTLPMLLDDLARRDDVWDADDGSTMVVLEFEKHADARAI
jgi:hypothetical protein